MVNEMRMAKREGKTSYLLVTGLLIVAVTVGTTVVHGRLTNRWGRSDAALKAAALAMANVPDRFGPWVKMDDQPFPPNVPGILDFAAAVNRTYMNPDNGQTVSLAMIVGPPGPTSTHVAEMCYTSKGWKLIDDTADLTIPASGADVHHFRHSRFESLALGHQRQEVCYAWRASDVWETPEIPRVAFGNAPRLFKIQVAATYAQEASNKDQSVCRDFLAALLPELDANVFQKLDE